jgi:hypothetical protein
MGWPMVRSTVAVGAVDARPVALRRRRTTRAVAAYVAALLAAAALAGCGSDKTDESSADRRTKAPSGDRQTPSPSPTVQELDPRLADRLHDPAALQHLLARPDFRLSYVDYSSATEAAAQVEACTGKGPCREAVLTTHDNWASWTGMMLPPRGYSAWIRALPGGATVVIITPADGDVHNPFPPFMLRGDGTAFSVRISTEAHDPSPGSVLLPAPDVPQANDLDASMWVLDPARAELYPASQQPCACPQYAVIGPDVDLDGTSHASIWDEQGTDQFTDDQWTFAQSRDNGRSWQTDRTDILPFKYDDGDFAAGPGQLLAMSQSTFQNDEPKFLEELYLSENERSWRRISLATAPKTVAGMEFTPDGTLLIADDTRHQLWRLPPGAKALEPVVNSPRVTRLETSGGVLIAYTGTRTIAVSTDGTKWTPVTPGSAH